jgi:hypothetical protein
MMEVLSPAGATSVATLPVTLLNRMSSIAWPPPSPPPQPGLDGCLPPCFPAINRWAIFRHPSGMLLKRGSKAPATNLTRAGFITLSRRRNKDIKDDKDKKKSWIYPYHP